MRLSVGVVVWATAFLCLARPVHDQLLVGNVGGVEALLIGLAVALPPVAGAAALGALGLLKVVPITTWPAMIVRDWRAAVKGLAIVAAGVVLTLPILWEAWVAFPTVLVNQVRGGGAETLGFNVIAIVRELVPGVPQLATGTQLAVLLSAGVLLIVSVRWARALDGWVGALLAATTAGLLLPGTFWFHYLVLFIPFVAYAWPRLPGWSKWFIVATAALLRFGPAPLRLFELGLVVAIVVLLLWVLRPAYTASSGELVRART